uniref:Uncharacterized protein n=1 Tax=Rhizophagus irregularis (strain DAOM 181602 / DAOM 197198 / MUCL 43194) TaxID=747089 RepID=U9TUT2_RHIID
MVALEGEINVISTSSGWTVQFVAISTIRSVGDNIISTSCLYGYTSKLGINVKFIQGDDSEEQKNSLN